MLTVVHETWHWKSLNYIRVVAPPESSGGFNPKGIRSGYAHLTYQPASDGALTGFNEGVINLQAIKTIFKNKDRISQELGISTVELEQRIRQSTSYKGNMRVVDVITAEIGNAQFRSRDSVWKTIRDGALFGEMMHLRSIERVFGRGSLKVLAAFQSGGTKEKGEEVDQKVLKYFTTKSEIERKSIARKILTPEMKEEFDERQLKGVEAFKRFFKKGLRR